MPYTDIIDLCMQHASFAFLMVLFLCWIITITVWLAGKNHPTKKFQAWPYGAVMLPALMLFGMIAMHIGPDSPLPEFDRVFSEKAPAHIAPFALKTFSILTHFGDTLTLTLLCISVSAALFYQRHFWLGAGYILAVGGNSILNRSLKAVFERIRPVQEHGVALADGWSFPSGHTSGTLVAYGMLAYIAIRLLPRRWQLPALLAAISIAVTTGFSRIALRHHYVSDVLAGLMSGTVWLALCIMLMEYIRISRKA
jgi:undecaprenyl-diphosphatase